MRLRKTLAFLLAFVGMAFAYDTMTVPVIAATAPAILTIACWAGAFMVWPKEPAAPST